MIITVKGVVGECICGTVPCSGLDCGPFSPDEAPRKKPAPKSPSELPEIRARAWATRRAKYGESGHRGSYAR